MNRTIQICIIFVVPIPSSGSNDDIFTVENNKILLNANSVLAFNLGGYNVVVEGTQDVELATLGTGSILYACISISNSEIAGQDENNLYEGVAFEVASSKPEVTYALPIAEISEGTATLIKSSYARFSASLMDYQIQCIDGLYDE